MTRINSAAERLFGARAETVGKPIEQVARDARIAQAVTDVLRWAEPSLRKRCRRSAMAVDGSHRAFRIRSTPMRDADDRLAGAVTLLEDITHLSELSRMKSSPLPRRRMNCAHR